MAALASPIHTPTSSPRRGPPIFDRQQSRVVPQPENTYSHGRSQSDVLSSPTLGHSDGSTRFSTFSSTLKPSSPSPFPSSTAPIPRSALASTVTPSSFHSGSGSGSGSRSSSYGVRPDGRNSDLGPMPMPTSMPEPVNPRNPHDARYPALTSSTSSRPFSSVPLADASASASTPTIKGKERAACPAPSANPADQIAGRPRMIPVESSMRERPATMMQPGERSHPQHRRRSRADWVVDINRARSCGEAWNERERVILVVGKPTPQSLAPILHSAQFEMTLLLIALSDPSPALEALASPSYALNATPEQQTVYPHIQTFTPSNTSGTAITGDQSHFLPPLLDQAAVLAQQWRNSLNAAPRKTWRSMSVGTSVSMGMGMGMGSRRGSVDTGNTTTPALTPRRLSPTEFPGRGTTRSSIDSTTSRPGSSFDSKSSSADHRPGLRDFGSSVSLADIAGSNGGRPSRSRLFSMSKAKPEAVATHSTATPFDAVIHFIPPPSASAPQRALQEMLHATVILTSAVTPILARKGSALPAAKLSSSSSTMTLSSPSADITPISLIHVVPPTAPAPLPEVIESFVLSFMPRFQVATERELQGMAVGLQAWLNKRIINSRSSSIGSVAEDEEDHGEMSGAEVLLFGGAQAPATTGETGQRARAYLGAWPQDRAVSAVGTGRQLSYGQSLSQPFTPRNQLPNHRHGRYQSFSASVPSTQQPYVNNASIDPKDTTRSDYSGSILGSVEPRTAAQPNGGSDAEIYNSIYESYSPPKPSLSLQTSPNSGGTITPRSRRAHSASSSPSRLPVSPARLPNSRSGLSNVLLPSDFGLDEEDERHTSSANYQHSHAQDQEQEQNQAHYVIPRSVRKNSNTTSDTTETGPSTPEFEGEADVPAIRSSSSSTSYGITPASHGGNEWFNGNSASGSSATSAGAKSSSVSGEDLAGQKLGPGQSGSKGKKEKGSGFGAFMRRFGRKA